LFTRGTLARLGELTGLSVERITTSFSPVNWVFSIRNFLSDWGASPTLVNWFSLTSVAALSFFSLIDLPLALAGKGAILLATFNRPVPENQSAWSETLHQL
jgi:hypothetical protein